MGRHDWQQQRNPEMSGAAAAVFYLCSRCGKEQSDREYIEKKSGANWIGGGGVG